MKFISASIISLTFALTACEKPVSKTSVNVNATPVTVANIKSDPLVTVSQVEPSESVSIKSAPVASYKATTETGKFIQGIKFGSKVSAAEIEMRVLTKGKQVARTELDLEVSYPVGLYLDKFEYRLRSSDLDEDFKVTSKIDLSQIKNFVKYVREKDLKYLNSLLPSDTQEDMSSLEDQLKKINEIEALEKGLIDMALEQLPSLSYIPPKLTELEIDYNVPFKNRDKMVELIVRTTMKLDKDEQGKIDWKIDHVKFETHEIRQNDIYLIQNSPKRSNNLSKIAQVFDFLKSVPVSNNAKKQMSQSFMFPDNGKFLESTIERSQEQDGNWKIDEIEIELEGSREGVRLNTLQNNGASKDLMLNTYKALIENNMEELGKYIHPSNRFYGTHDEVLKKHKAEFEKMLKHIPEIPQMPSEVFTYRLRYPIGDLKGLSIDIMFNVDEWSGNKLKLSRFGVSAPR